MNSIGNNYKSVEWRKAAKNQVFGYSFVKSKKIKYGKIVRKLARLNRRSSNDRL